MKKLILRSLLLLLPIAMVLAGINYSIDPAYQFSEEFYQKAAELLTSNDIVLIGDCDERKLIKSFIKKKNKVDVLILGSSRSLIINKSLIGDSSVLNLSVSAADIEDLLAIYQLYESNLGIPKKILIGIDPWMLNINRKSDGFIPLAESFNEMADKLKIKKELNHSRSKFNQVKTLFSPDYFQLSLLSIYKNGFAKSMPEIAKSSSDSYDIKTTYGTLIYKSNWQNTQNLIEIAAKRYISEKEIYGFNDYFEVSQTRLNILEHFFDYLTNKKVKIDVLLSPYHPIVWNYFESNSAKYNVVKESEQRMRKICKKHHLNVIGSYSPEKFSLISTDFYDGMHPNLIGLGKIFSKEIK